MEFKAEIDIMPLEALLDPQGKAVSNNMKNLGLEAIQNVRIGKHITLTVDAENESEADRLVNESCKRLLANEIMESYTFSITKLN